MTILPEELRTEPDGSLYLPWSTACPWCDDGVDDEAWRNGQSRACRYCGPHWVPPAVYVDADSDGWMDGVEQVRARYCDAAGTLDLEQVELIVLHRLGRGRGFDGPRYVSNCGDDRQVSWHFTVHHEGYDHRLTQHVPITRKAWHAGRRGNVGLGIELDAHPSVDVHAPHDEATIATLVDLLVSLKARMPALKRIVSHRFLAPTRRSDPGEAFPWERLNGLGVELEG